MNFTTKQKDFGKELTKAKEVSYNENLKNYSSKQSFVSNSNISNSTTKEFKNSTSYKSYIKQANETMPIDKFNSLNIKKYFFYFEYIFIKVILILLLVFSPYYLIGYLMTIDFVNIKFNEKFLFCVGIIYCTVCLCLLVYETKIILVKFCEYCIMLKDYFNLTIFPTIRKEERNCTKLIEEVIGQTDTEIKLNKIRKTLVQEEGKIDSYTTIKFDKEGNSITKNSIKPQIYQNQSMIKKDYLPSYTTNVKFNLKENNILLNDYSGNYSHLKTCHYAFSNNKDHFQQDNHNIQRANSLLGEENQFPKSFSTQSNDIIKDKSQFILNQIFFNIYNNKEYHCELTKIIETKNDFDIQLANINFSYEISKCTNNLKKAFIETLLPNILDLHINNLTALNRDFGGVNINFTDLSQASIDENYLKLNINNQRFDYDGDKEQIKVFYGDSFALNLLLSSLECKIQQIERLDKILNEKENISLGINTNTKNTNNLPKISNEKYNPLTETTLYSIKQQKLEKIQQFKQLHFEISNRININKLLITSESSSLKNPLKMVLIEYSITRLEDLKTNSLWNYLWNKGGEYLGHNWNSFFPTDSNLIANIFLENIQSLINVDNNFMCFLLSYPRKINLEKNQELFIYRTTDKYEETNFSVIYKSHLINFNQVSF